MRRGGREGFLHRFQEGVGHETASGPVDVFVAVTVLLGYVVAEGCDQA